jgi:hypothetical protein
LGQGVHVIKLFAAANYIRMAEWLNMFGSDTHSCLLCRKTSEEGEKDLQQRLQLNIGDGYTLAVKL